MRLAAEAGNRMLGAGQVVQQLQQLGEVLCQQLPIPLFCNNPGCVNLAKEADLQLAGGKGCVCSGCVVAHYGGSDCQKAHWTQHKPVCKRLRGRKVPALATTVY